MARIESASAVLLRSSRPAVTSYRALLLIRVLLVLSASAPLAVAAHPPAGVKRLPVVDMQDIRFVRVASGGEVLNAWVWAVTQDNQGFIWLAADTGLYRFDGYVLKQYRHDPGDPNTISSDEIRTVFRDRDGILWIGTDSAGLDRYDPARGVFTHYRHKSGVEGSLTSAVIYSVYQDSRAALWICTGGGLDRLDPGAGTFVHYRHDPQDPNSLSSSVVYRVYEDRQGNIWVSTEQGFNKLDRATGRANRFIHDPANPHSLGGTRASAILEDRFGIIWVAAGNGLSALDVTSREFTRYSFHSEEPGPEDMVGPTTIHEDADGGLWVGTLGNGLLKLDAERKQFRRYTRDVSNPESLPHHTVADIFEDREGVVWVATQGGVSRFLRRPPAFTNYRAGMGRSQPLQDNVVWSVQTDRSGYLWIGTETALHRLDRGTGRVSVYRHDPKNPNSISHDAVSAIREDRSGNLWFGTYGGGLNSYDPAAGRFIAYRSNPKKAGSLSNDLVMCLLVDHEGTLWAGTQSGGLNRYDPATRRFESFRRDPGDPRSLSDDNVTALFESRAGELWAGTFAGGLNRFDRRSRQFKRYGFDSRTASGLSQIAVRSIHEDNGGVLWVGTADGLYRREPSSESFTKFTIKGTALNGTVGAILEDRKGDLWLATKAGLVRVSPRTGEYRVYSESDGLPGNYFGKYGGEAACRTPRGELVFGSTNGLTVFDPDQLSTNPYVPPVVLTDFLLFNKPVSPGKGTPLQMPIWATGSLTLNHEQSIFSLAFAALSYAAPQHNRYRYRLEPLEENWNDVDSTRRLATYTSLPAGTYTFRVQGSNNDGVWNETGLRLALTILPPWWQALWFRTVATLCVAGAILAGYRLRTKSLRAAATQLEIQVAERTQELRAAMHSAKIAKDAAEVAKEAAETANRSKSAFLAHMSHELRTPLNAILGFAGLLRSDATTEKQRADLDIIHRSGEHLLTLINDVLDIAKVEAGRIPVEIAPCDAGRLADDVTDMMRVRAAAKNVELRLVRPPHFPRSVETDGPKLRQVLVNLVGNAVKFTQRGSVTLRLDARSASNADDVLLIFEVEDTGVGVQVEDQERIFEPFVQLGNVREQRGTGLGLAISREFANLLGGTVAVRSVPGQGSLFRLELPAKLADKSEVKASSDEREYVLLPDPRQEAKRILVVDDEPENRALLQRLLQNAGFQVDMAADGLQAVEMFRSWRPHFIWMDLRMPVMDGIEAARRIRELDGGRQVKIVAVTASAYASERSQVLSAGMDGFVRKPFRMSEIFDCLASHLGVRYRPDGPVSQPPDRSPAVLLPEALRALPNELRNELRAAVTTLDEVRIAAVIERISKTDAALAEVLARCAEGLAYTSIFRAIEALQGSSSASSA